MTDAPASHHDGGLHRLLNKAGIYDTVQRLLLRRGTRERYVREFVRPFPGCRILDIGCGPADILGYLPNSIGEYAGFDMNPGYIDAAQRRWGSRGTFRCEKVGDAAPVSRVYDIVLANGILHHLDDAEAGRLVAIAHDALRSGGCLVTYDNVYIEHQNPLARWLIDRDRGRAVRTREAYEGIARACFSRIESAILHDTLKVPYTIFVMRCTKE